MRHLKGCGGMDPRWPNLPCNGCAPRSDGLSEMGRWDPKGFEADGDGIWVRELSPRCFIIVRYTDLMEHIPESEQGPEFLATRYDATVSMVDLDAIGRSEVTQALSGWDLSDGGCEECGTCKGRGTLEQVYYSGPCLIPDCFDGSIVPPRAQAEECIRYGLHGPIGGGNGGNLRQVLRSARREANHLMADADAREDALAKPVNRIGSTAAEFMRGDITAGLERAGASIPTPFPDWDAALDYASKHRAIGYLAPLDHRPVWVPAEREGRIIKMRPESAQGDPFDADENHLDRMRKPSSPPPSSGAIRMDVKMGQVPSDDPIAYSMGFLHGYQGSALPAEESDLADAYLEGRKVGADVRIGRSPVPAWVS